MSTFMLCELITRWITARALLKYGSSSPWETTWISVIFPPEMVTCTVITLLYPRADPVYVPSFSWPMSMPKFDSITGSFASCFSEVASAVFSSWASAWAVETMELGSNTSG